MRFRGKVVLITGASSGIGAAVARAFAADGAATTLCARRVERLDALARELRASGVRALGMRCDVTRPEEVAAAVTRTISELGQLDVVVANAGYSVTGGIDRLDLGDYRRQFEASFFGVVTTIKAALASLVATKGQIIVVSSVLGRVAQSRLSAYVACKHAVSGLADALRMELNEQGIGVTLVCPGYVKTELRRVDNRGIYDPSRPDKLSKRAADADDCGRAIVRAAVARKRELVWPASAKPIVFVGRHMPGLWSSVLRRKPRRGPRGGA
jgi:short-subunit dehydrogenase